jgi:hypothetical protein
VAVNRGRKLNDADRRARDRLILGERSQGSTWAEIAAKFDLSESSARRGAANAARLAAEAGLAEIDAGKLLEEIVRAEARALYRLEELILDDNAAVAVGACRAVGSVGADLRASLVAAGLIPDSGAEIRIRAELQAVVRALFAVGERTGIDIREVHDAIAAEPALARRVTP